MEDEDPMVKVRRKTLAFSIFLALFIVIAAVLIWSPQPNSPDRSPILTPSITTQQTAKTISSPKDLEVEAVETPLITHVIRIPVNQTVNDIFVYRNPESEESCEVICEIPALLSIYVKEVNTPGIIEIAINDNYVGYVPVTTTGETMIMSPCGCDPACTCTILIGENKITFLSVNFSGEIEYRVEPLS